MARVRVIAGLVAAALASGCGKSEPSHTNFPPVGVPPPPPSGGVIKPAPADATKTPAPKDSPK